MAHDMNSRASGTFKPFGCNDPRVYNNTAGGSAMPKNRMLSGRNEDRIRDLFYDAIDAFPADARADAELWLFECEIARIFFRSIILEVPPARMRRRRDWH
jgi:hypothetical protein